ncbi:MAG: YgiT-type zinc finger domain-containing protein [Desulfobacterales bacterium CG23_combo_of_CG06-09_8_20_14_all_51_8]|nr:MAG: YgiT-type zinc finger domain-containing protein [Desulfobacterales bacterium CG23_combo_of_CG06-09_8_20_14_all_51_8]
MMFTHGCPLCSGELYEGTSTFTVDKQAVLVVVRNVPARVCRQCGESWIKDAVSEKLEQIVVDAKLKHRQLEVIDMAA